jgi:hypothetical protein
MGVGDFFRLGVDCEGASTAYHDSSVRVSIDTHGMASVQLSPSSYCLDCLCMCRDLRICYLSTLATCCLSPNVHGWSALSGIRIGLGCDHWETVTAGIWLA